MKLKVLATAIAAPVLLSGCASMFSGGDNFTRVTSDVSPVPFEITDKSGEVVASGETPEIVKLNPRESLISRNLFTIKAFGPGGESEQSFESEFNHTTWWSQVVPGYGTVSQIIDWGTGAIWKTPEAVDIKVKKGG